MNAIQRLPKPVEVTPQSETLRTFDSRDILQDNAQVRLLLDGQTYFLRITRAGKLILTK
jgi:hemin uptake protein HemP